ncbi:MAG TPA: DUF1330 domain-containing protein [Caulobacteraceae bacterium]|jgi:uncharacterized protein (DUF1330 family)|nr:DUF1330 domain-containing protein [Caulobacteraceae bacterium]
MKGYVVAMVEVNDPAAYEAYRSRTADVIAQYGGRFIVRGGQVEVREGEFRRNRLVVLEFPSLDAARTFYDSPEYQAILPLRTRAAEADLLLVEGWDG